MKNRLLISFLLSLLAAIFITALSFLQLGQRYELFFHDFWFNLKGSRNVPRDVVVVAMDEVSYKNLNVPLNQAWPRELHAKLLEKLSQYNVKKVIFDILFIDRGVNEHADQALEEAIKRVPTYLGAEASQQLVSSAGGSFVLDELLEPFEPFRKAAKGIALVGLPDNDGIIRNFFTDRTDRTRDIRSLAEVGGPDNLEFKPKNRDLVNYYGPSRTIPTYSYYQVLEEERPFSKEVLEGKTVYVGMSLRSETGPSKKDLFNTPFYQSPMFGVEVHATAAANFIDQSWIRRLSRASESLLIFVAATLFSTAIFYSSPIAGAVILLSGMIGWLILSFVLFSNYIFLPGALYFLGLFPFLYTIATFSSFLKTRKAEQKLRQAFELYVSPQMAAQLHGEAVIELGGKKVWATALFTDIARFTDITEELPPERAAEMLNDYFTQVMEVVFENKGTLIKFIGDAVFVIWGAPIAIDNHAELAVKTALLLGQEVARFNNTKKYPELRTRIGVHTGPMVVGNLGSKKRFDYTAIGDSVNLCSRIEGINKYFNTSVLFSESTRKDGGLNDRALPVGEIKVKGKKEIISLFTILEPSPKDEVKILLNDALVNFRQRKWQDASSLFLQLSKIETRLAGVADFYIAYMDGIKMRGIAEDWAGEVEFEHK